MPIEISVNGAPRQVPAHTRVSDLIRELELTPEQVAVERNRRLVRRSEHAATVLDAGDELEIVTLVGGG